MLNTKIAVLVITAFALGFALSEYRHKMVLEALHAANKNTPIIMPSAVLNAGDGSYPPDLLLSKLLAPEVVTQENTALAHPTISESFSWIQVNQLIANSQYLEAVRLLESRMGNPADAARAWLLLATIYKKQGQVIAAVDAWFRYLTLELDSQKNEQARNHIRQYLLHINATPALFNNDYSWLMSQFDELLKYQANDGELHLIMATLLMELKDDYQAQYHALMAVNDPQVQPRAEAVLAKLNGKNTQNEVVIPLQRYGNQYLIDTLIEGYSAHLLVDTGASLSGLSSRYTAQYPSLLKSTKPIRLNTASGAQDSVLFTVTHIDMGSLVFKQHILAQLPMDSSVEFDGLLGIDILGRFDFVIDQNAATLTLKPRKQ